MKSFGEALFWTVLVGVIVVALSALNGCKGDQIVIDNDTPDCPAGMEYDEELNACINEDDQGVIEIGDEFDLLITLSDCRTNEEIDVRVINFYALNGPIDGYEVDIQKLINHPVGVYLVNNLIMGDIYYVEIAEDGYITLEGEMQITQQTDRLCLYPEDIVVEPDGNDPLAGFQACLEAGNSFGMCCITFTDPMFDLVCNR